MCADFFAGSGGYGCWSNTRIDADPRTWTELDAADYDFPAGARHASMLRVSQDELDALVEHYRGATAYHIRSTYTDSMARAHYMAHSWFHVVMTRLDDTSGNLLTDDFIWRVVPGLADPGDPDLVSFQVTTSGLTDHYLRIDSGNPSRYPSCSETSNHIGEACDVPLADQHHLGWVDTFEDTATFRSDATFRRTTALNGNSGMVSFQWYGDATRYLRYNSFQIFAYPIDGSAVQNEAASFTLEG